MHTHILVGITKLEHIQISKQIQPIIETPVLNLKKIVKQKNHNYEENYHRLEYYCVYFILDH